MAKLPRIVAIIPIAGGLEPGAADTTQNVSPALASTANPI